MQRQRPSSGYSGYSSTCAIPRETEDDGKNDEKTAAKKEPKYNFCGALGLMKTETNVDSKSAGSPCGTSQKLDESLKLDLKIYKRTATQATEFRSDNDSEQDENKNKKDKDKPDKKFTEDNIEDASKEDEDKSAKKLTEDNIEDKNKKDEDIPSKKLAEDDIEFQKPYPKKVPVCPEQKLSTHQRTAVMRTLRPLPPPKDFGRPLVLATHLVPSLSIGLFEVLVEALEAATGRAVVILYEARADRPVYTDVTDIAILPAGDNWDHGKLLPVSFVFEHHCNKTFSPYVYADVVVATDRAPHVETLMDLRGHRCALPDRKKKIGATTLLFNYLHSKGEGPAFFGNTLDANSQVSALQMVAGKQVEVCILESPVIKFHRQSLPGVYSLHILSSLGPLPPYRFMVNNKLAPEIVEKIKDYLLNIRNDSVWLEKFAPYSVLGFAEYDKNIFDIQEMKPVATSTPYY